MTPPKEMTVIKKVFKGKREGKKKKGGRKMTSGIWRTQFTTLAHQTRPGWGLLQRRGW